MLYACVWVLPASCHYFIEHSLYLIRFNLDSRFIFFPLPLEIPQWQTAVKKTLRHTCNIYKASAARDYPSMRLSRPQVWISNQTQQSQILHWLEVHTLTLKDSVLAGFVWLVVFWHVAKDQTDWQSCRAEESCGKLSTVSASDSLCPLHYSLINTASAQCSRQTRGLRSIHTRLIPWLGHGRKCFSWGWQPLQHFQIPTSFGRAEWSRCSTVSEARFPGHTAAPFPNTAHARACGLAALLPQEGLTAGRPVYQYVIQKDTRETPKHIHGSRKRRR